MSDPTDPVDSADRSDSREALGSDGLPVADQPAGWPVTASEDLHRDDWVLALRADTLHRPGESADRSFRRLVVELPGAVMVLAVDEEDRAVLLRHYRHPVRSRLVELPAGMLDQPGEDPVLAARRELREEVGLAADHWRHLVTVHPSPGTSSERHTVYLATGLHAVDRDFELEHEEAEMTQLRVPVDDVVDAVLDGRVADAPLAIAVLAYDVLRRRGVSLHQ